MARPLVLIALALTTAASVARADDQPAIDRGRALLRLLVDGKYADFAAAGDEAVQKAMDADKVAQLWGGITFQLGKYEGEKSVSVKTAGAHRAVSLVSRFERGSLTLRLVLDGQDRLAGLWIDRVEPTVSYTPPDYVDPNAFTEEKVTVTAGKFDLPGTLTLPKTREKHRAVVLVHGSGPHDQDETIGPNKVFKDVAWGLATRGIAVLRYDKRTKAHPTACKPDEWTLDTEVVDDALAAVRLLRERSDIDPARVYVVGHSLGAIAAPFIAQRDRKLAGIVLLAGSPRPALDLIADQVEYLGGLDPNGAAETQRHVENLRKAVVSIRAGRLDEAGDVIGIPARYLAWFDRLPTLETAQKLEIPMLLVHGGRDYQVTRKDFDAWQAGLKARPNVTFKLYDPLNHLFIAGEGKPTPAEYQKAGHVDAAVVRDVAEWISRN